MNLKRATKYLIFDMSTILSCLAVFYFLCFLIETVVVMWYIIKNVVRQLLQVSFRVSFEHFKAQIKAKEEETKDG